MRLENSEFSKELKISARNLHAFLTGDEDSQVP